MYNILTGRQEQVLFVKSKIYDVFYLKNTFSVITQKLYLLENIYGRH